MKRYIRSNSESPWIVITDKNWNRFLDRIEHETGLTVDSACRRRRRGDNWIELFDEFGNTFESEITEYTDGTYEFRGENMH